MGNLLGVTTLSTRPLRLHEVVTVAQGGSVALDAAVDDRLIASRAVIDRILASGETVYGINTGFGRLADVRIPDDQLVQLQVNLVRSHAVGVGDPLSIPETRAMMLLRASVLAQGFSGARPTTLHHLVEMINQKVTPVVPSRGSVGASGDLAPLAHLALAMIGEGECWGPNGVRIPAAQALSSAGLTPLSLAAKEGLALLNGTQAIGAVGSLALARALRLAHVADAAGIMTLEALKGTPTAFDARIHAARRHAGQVAAAAHLRALMEASEIRESHRGEHDPRVQDAYSERCMPQVHGAARTALSHLQSLLEDETVAATDNPLVFPEGDVISGGNFHAAPLAAALDYAALAVTDLVSISERRVDRLVNPDSNEGLPAFLARDAGISSGFMMAHVTVAALLSECRVLAHPASVDSVPTSGGKEDHVSMGMTCALKFRHLVELAERALAIELIAAAEGMEHRRPLRASEPIERVHAAIRRHVAPLTQDRSLSHDIETVAGLLRDGQLDTHVESIWQLIP